MSGHSVFDLLFTELEVNSVLHEKYVNVSGNVTPLSTYKRQQLKLHENDIPVASRRALPPPCSTNTHVQSSRGVRRTGMIP